MSQILFTSSCYIKHAIIGFIYFKGSETNLPYILKYGLLASYKNVKSVLQKKKINMYRCKSIPYWFLSTTLKRKAEDISYDLMLILNAHRYLMYIK